MSYFYMTPAKGNLPAYLLDVIVHERLKCLKATIQGKTIGYNEYMIEGSFYDNVGHFMLCILAIIIEKSEFSQFLIRSEQELFKSRLACITSYDLRCLAKKLLKIIKKTEQLPFYVGALQILCRHLMLKKLAQHICTSDHNKICREYSIKIHFKHCLQFIAKRQVELKDGIASIPCCQWKSYLITLFRTHLSKRLLVENLDFLRYDPRICELISKLKYEMPLLLSLNSVKEPLQSRNIDKISKQFPPCMLNLHKTLREKHRLSHYQRFYYSLFLKDIGMSVNEAIYFWKNEYTKDPSGKNSCCHNWEKNEKKFTYSIRHLYGLEGGHKNYSSYNCQYIQSSESSCSEGGCPFKSFDNERLISLLQISPNFKSELDKFTDNNEYTLACLAYLNMETDCDLDCDNVSFNFTPVKYYEIMSLKKLM